jgi:DNA-binding MarR family transcriptional regulator
MGIAMKEKFDSNSETNSIYLWKLLDQSRFAIARLRGIELVQFDLTIEQSSILQTLMENGGSLTTKELEEETMRQPNSISILVNRMVKMGLLRRERSKSRQRHRIYLTREGEDLIKRVTLVSIEMTFSALTAEEKQQTSEYLNKLLENARELLGIPHHPPILKYLKEKMGVEELASEK